MVDGSVDHVLAFGLSTYFVEQYGAALSEFRRVTKRQGLVIVTGSAVHPKLDLLEAASAANLHLIEEKEGFCTVASGQKRYHASSRLFEAPQGAAYDPPVSKGGGLQPAAND